MTDVAHIELIVAADEPALFFRSIRGAESYLEAIDVNDGVYRGAWGSEGQPHRIYAIDDCVHIDPLIDEAEQPDQLAGVLVTFLHAIGRPAAASDGLASLLAECEPYAQ